MAYPLLSAVKVLLAVQASTASVSGVVRDAERGEPIGGAVVALADLERHTITDSAGHYIFHDVPAGPQHITVDLIGFASRTLHALVPREGRLEINIELHPDPVPVAGVEARSLVPLRDLDDGDAATFPDRVVSLAAARNDPLQSEPDLLQALAGGEVALRPESPSGIHVRGAASDQVVYLLDGIPVFSPYHTAGTFSAWSPEAISQVRLTAAPATVARPDALAGVVSAETRAPGSRIGAQGSVSTTQARLTVDGPLGSGAAGYLLSIRSGFPGFIFPADETSYVRSEGGDWLAKLESPLLSGQLQALAYDSDNEIGAAADAMGGGANDQEAARNTFAWHSRSTGGGWTGALGRATLNLRAWRAAVDASALWSNDAEEQRLTAKRRDEGLIATVEIGRGERHTSAGLRLRRSRASYQLLEESSDSPSLSLRSRTPVVAPFLLHRRPISERVEVELAVAAPLARGRVHVSPHGQVRWRPTHSISLTGGYSRLYQFEQSLRNPESVVSNIFPVDLYVGADAGGLPVARSDRGIVAVDYRPLAGLRVGAEVYAQRFDRLALVAPLDADPYATSGFTAGSSRARGVSIAAGLSAARYGAVFSYGFQDIDLTYGDTTYVPDHGAAHLISAGVIIFPSVTSSIRVGMTGMLGRRTTRLVSPIEFESCNILDRGCEFAGSPQGRDEPLGASRLPAYLRIDVGLRKHWHLRLGDRDGLLGVFGSVTNVLGRSNVLALSDDPAGGEPLAIELRPRAPLVVGVDWRF